jgi:hypothetical protein
MKGLERICVAFAVAACVAAEVCAAPAKTRARRKVPRNAAVPAAEAPSDAVDAETPPPAPAGIPPREAFANCMENLCLDSVYEEKGRCPCSGEIARIEKVLSGIDELQAKADGENAALESLLNNGGNGGESTSDMVASIMDDVDSSGWNTAAATNFRLGERAFEQCSELAPDAPSEDRKKWLQLYMNKVDADCAAYATLLKERADSLLDFYLQVKKNRETFDRQELDKVDQLDEGLCYLEYEACAKDECGDRFAGCAGDLKMHAMLQKCRTINRGKCESSLMKVLGDLTDFIRSEIKVSRKRW